MFNREALYQGFLNITVHLHCQIQIPDDQEWRSERCVGSDELFVGEVIVDRVRQVAESLPASQQVPTEINKCLLILKFKKSMFWFILFCFFIPNVQ
jgi:hypothetical protein